VSADRIPEVDVAVVGLGGIGSAAADWLSRRSGTHVVGFERFAMEHEYGASHDHSRIIRLSYHRPDYVRLARRAYATWGEVEAEAGSSVVTRTAASDTIRAHAIPAM
jgi:sarcosine oxidase